MVTPAASASAAHATSATAAQAPRQQLSSYTAYEKNGLQITLTPRVSSTQPGVVQILARFTAAEKVEGINFQVAVPKTQQLQMQAMSRNDVEAGTTETQQMRVLTPVGAQVRLRMRISYTKGGEAVTDQQDFAGFPSDLTAAR